jgi:hypothetical protein
LATEEKIEWMTRRNSPFHLRHQRYPPWSGRSSLGGPLEDASVRELVPRRGLDFSGPI